MQKINLISQITPLEHLTNLSAYLDKQIYIKRDDLCGRGGGGNKARKYERIVADAINQDSDTLIIAGHYQSNAARQLVAVAGQLGLNSIVVCKSLISQVNETFNQTGNAFLMSLMGAEIVGIEDHDDYDQEMTKVAERLESEGKKPYKIPFGGSNLLGVLGYVDCANEIIEQLESASYPDHVVVAMGSGGTQAGLISGFHARETATKVLGFSVAYDQHTATNMVSDLVNEAHSVLRQDKKQKPEILVNDKFIGEGYGIPTQEGIEAIKLLARLEGIFLDPVYTGKAMAGLIALIEKGEISKDETIVFVHTGGMPLVHAYYDQLI